MSDAVRQRFDAMVDAGDSERVQDRHFVALFTPESGLRYGLVDDLSWAVVDGDQLTVFQRGSELAFVEVLEHRRSEFDEWLEQGAAASGFPVDEVLFSFPTTELLQVIFEGSSQHFCRMALMWLQPSELRSLRSVLLGVAESTAWPAALRELAARLVVRE
ncbi:MAG: hypothetical protein DRI90_09705 [Deltaproteobacteria bacterium]|nr:MAG: hypothetical protein DRI90_09705 [Deltaproteobacteria bacterium]